MATFWLYLYPPEGSSFFVPHGHIFRMHHDAGREAHRKAVDGDEIMGDKELSYGRHRRGVLKV